MNNQHLEQIRNIVCSSLLISDISVEEDLFETGHLDSIGIVNILVALEEEFEIQLSMDELDLEKFRSVGQIYQLLASRLDSSVQGASAARQ